MICLQISPSEIRAVANQFCSLAFS